MRWMEETLMAYIKKRGSKKELVRDVPMPSVAQVTETVRTADAESKSDVIGLRFELTLGDYKVSLTEMERDVIIQTWAKQQKLFE
jgi:hypothetical protein